MTKMSSLCCDRRLTSVQSTSGTPQGGVISIDLLGGEGCIKLIT